MSERIPKLSNSEFISFAKILNESDLHYENKDQRLKSMEKSFEKMNKTIMDKIYIFNLSELVEILYLWVKLDLHDQNHSLTNTIFNYL